VHDYWEEVYLISGDLTVGNDEKGEGGTAFAPNTYASRPPGAYHGPFKSKSGCMLFESHYFEPVGCVSRVHGAAAKSCITFDLTILVLRVVAGVLRLRPTKRGIPALMTAP